MKTSGKHFVLALCFVHGTTIATLPFQESNNGGSAVDNSSGAATTEILTGIGLNIDTTRQTSSDFDSEALNEDMTNTQPTKMSTLKMLLEQINAILDLSEKLTHRRTVLIVYDEDASNRFESGSNTMELMLRLCHQRLLATVTWQLDEQLLRNRSAMKLVSHAFATMIFHVVLLLCTDKTLSTNFIQKVQEMDHKDNNIYWIFVEAEDEEDTNPGSIGKINTTFIAALQYQEKLVIPRSRRISKTSSSPPNGYSFVAPIGPADNVQIVTMGSWQDEELNFDVERAAKQWNNFRGRRVTVTTVNRGETQGARPGRDGRLMGYGMIFDIIDLMSTYRNISYDVILSSDNFYGSRLSNGSWDGMMGQLRNKVAQMTAAVFQITDERAAVVEFSTPIFDEMMQILQQRPTESRRSDNLFLPFTPKVWMILFLLTALTGLTTFAVVTVHVRQRKMLDSEGEEPEDLRLQFTLKECIWITFRLLIAQATDKEPKIIAGRLVVLAWALASIVVSSMYTANLTAFLTVPKYDVKFKKLSDISRYPETVWLVKKSAAFVSEIETPNSTYSHLLPDLQSGRGLAIAGDDEAANLVLKKGYVYLQKVTTVDSLILFDLKKTGKCHFCVGSEVFFKTSASMAFQKGSYYRNIVDSFIWELNKFGINEYLYRNYYPTGMVCQLSVAPQERSMSVGDYVTLYLLLVGGLVLAAVAFLAERVLNGKQMKFCNAREKFPPAE